MNQKIQIIDNSCQTGLINFQNIIKKIDNKKTYQKIIRQANRIYQLTTFKVQNMTPTKARKIYNLITQKYQQNLGLKQQAWLQNQRKLYIWILLCHSFIQSKYINQLNLQDYSLLKSIFHNKNQHFLKFQSYRIIRKKQKQNKWTLQQDNLLLNIIKQKKQSNNNQNDWNQISKLFFNSSKQKLYRPAKQIRERWINHLDPNKIKGVWTIQQDLILMKFVLKNGKKWSQISKILQDMKSQHMIKNRFNSIIKKAQKQLKIVKQNKIIKRLVSSLEQSKINKQQQLNKQKQQFNLKEDFKTSTISSNYQNNIQIQQKLQEKQHQAQYISYQYNKQIFQKNRKFPFNISQRISLIQQQDDSFEEQKYYQQENCDKKKLETPIFTPFQIIDKKQLYPFNIHSPLFSAVNNFTPSIFLFDQNHKQKGAFRAMQQSFYFRANSIQYNRNYNSNFDKFSDQKQ